eukprot:TRINITY_DN4975_c0_g1_i4.p2 TRINITY_DN4975_c0_g1~~TRINITY_DN4975_c0_g1_i4.p2  ORF type:complete len:472 (+),score=112.56 TRINITY_DN4975_c0_g1_i4:2546-3961(+)
MYCYSHCTICFCHCAQMAAIWNPRAACSEIPLLTGSDVHVLQYVIREKGVLIRPKKVEDAVPKKVEKPASLGLGGGQWKAPLDKGLDDIPLVTFPLNISTLFKDYEPPSRKLSVPEPASPVVPKAAGDEVSSPPAHQELTTGERNRRLHERQDQRKHLLATLTSKLHVLEAELSTRKAQASLTASDSLMQTVDLIQGRLATYHKVMFNGFLLRDTHARGRITKEAAASLVAEMSNEQHVVVEGDDEGDGSYSFADVLHFANSYNKQGELALQFKSLSGAAAVKQFKERHAKKMAGVLSRSAMVGMASEVVSIVGLVSVGCVVLAASGVRHVADDACLPARLARMAEEDVLAASAYSEREYFNIFVDILQESYQESFDAKLQLEAKARKELQHNDGWLTDPDLESVENLFKTFSEECDTHDRIALDDLPTFALFLGIKLTHSQMCVTRQLYGLRMDLMEMLTWYTLVKRKKI